MYKAPGGELAPFVWVCADGRQVEDVKAQLAALAGLYPRTIDDIRAARTAPVRSSADIIEAVSQGTLGTSDKQIIHEQICPDLKPSITIEITWRTGKPPDPGKQRVRNETHLQVRA
jgi:hypothetical protein